MWRLTTTNDLYGPILISSFWRGLPPDVKKIDAAYEKPRSPYDIYLFSGEFVNYEIAGNVLLERLSIKRFSEVIFFHLWIVFLQAIDIGPSRIPE